MSSKPLSGLTIFFPAYHDENTVEPLTRASIAVARQLTDDYEVLVIDDASPDRTGQIADRLAREDAHVRVIHHPQNLGVGEAMKSGYRSSTKDWVFYTDGDMQYDVSELPLLAKHAEKSDVIVGYRLKRAEGLSRFFTSRCFHALAFILFGLHFRTNGALIDTEILLQARKLGPVVEVGVHHYPRKFGRSLCLNRRLVFGMLRDMVVLRLKLWGLG